MAFSRKTINATEALRIGLITDVFSAENALDETKCLANQIAQGPPKALAITKANIEMAAQIGFEATLKLEENTQGLLIFGDEHFEGRQAFFEKRKPSF